MPIEASVHTIGCVPTKVVYQLDTVNLRQRITGPATENASGSKESGERDQLLVPTVSCFVPRKVQESFPLSLPVSRGYASIANPRVDHDDSITLVAARPVSEQKLGIEYSEMDGKWMELSNGTITSSWPLL